MQYDFVLEVGDFSLADTLSCGQGFRWHTEGGWFVLPVNGRYLHVCQKNELLYVAGTSQDDAAQLRHYLSLDDDYELYKRILSQYDVLRRAVEYAPGIRVIKQPFWEATCTFIISQNNNIPRIAGITDRLCNLFGLLTETGFDFPTPQRLATLELNDLAPLRAGFRAKYILDAAQRFASGEIDAHSALVLPLEQARAMLMRIHGVGPKVADCALLFGAARYDAFPVDVWMKKAISVLLPHGLPADVRPIAGIAQQFLFHYARTSGVLSGKT